MAILQKIDELWADVKALGYTEDDIKPIKGSKVGKYELYKCLERHYMAEWSKAGTLTRGSRIIHTLIDESPVLATAHLKDEDWEAVLNDESMILEVKHDGCFSYETPVLLSDGTTLPIGKIVDEKLPVEVLSYDEKSQKVVVQKIVNWFDNGFKSLDQWCCPRPDLSGRSISHSYETSILGFRNTGRITSTDNLLWVTKNHKFFNGSGYSPAETNQTAYRISLGFNDTQRSVIIGTLLGDSWLTIDPRSLYQSPRLGCSHSSYQRDYCLAKKHLLDFALPNGVQKSVSGFGSHMVSFHTHPLPALHEFWKLFYSQERSAEYSPRSITSDLVLTPLSLAIWYCDDGSRDKPRSELGPDSKTTNCFSRAKLATDSFRPSDVDILVSKLCEMGYSCKKTPARSTTPERPQFGIQIDTRGSQKFFRDIADYVHPDCSYKLPLELQSRAGNIRWWEDTQIEYSISPVGMKLTNHSQLPIYSSSRFYQKAYDIEVENTHNYFANGFLVHNCRCIVAGHPSEGMSFFGRNRLVHYGTFAEYTDQFVGLTRADTVGKFDFPFVLDCEVISTSPSFNGRVVSETVLQAVQQVLSLNREDSHRLQVEAGLPIRFVVFDCLWVGDQDLRFTPLKDRIPKRDEVVRKLQQAGLTQFEMIQSWTGLSKQLKLDLFHDLVAQGGEGLIIKDPCDDIGVGLENRGSATSHFVKPTSKQWASRIRFVKLKKTLSDVRGGDSIALWIDSGEPGEVSTTRPDNHKLISTLVMKCWLMPDGVEHIVARISDLTDEQRVLVTSYDEDGNPVLNPMFQGAVLECEANKVTSKSLMCGHARRYRQSWLRTDKVASDCVLTREFLESNAI